MHTSTDHTEDVLSVNFNHTHAYTAVLLVVMIGSNTSVLRIRHFYYVVTYKTDERPKVLFIQFQNISVAAMLPATLPIRIHFTFKNYMTRNKTDKNS